METFFAPNDIAYAWIALIAVAVDQIVLARVLPPHVWAALRLPSTFLHEFAHWFVAAVQGGKPRIVSLRPRVEEDGSVSLGYTVWGDLALGPVGRMLVAFAPFGWLFVAMIVARTTLTEPQTLLSGLGWLWLSLLLAGAGLRLSASDFAGMGKLMTVGVVIFLAALMLNAAMIVPGFLCRSFGTLCTVQAGG